MSFQIDTMNKIFKCVNVYLIKDVIRWQCSDLVPAASNAAFLGGLLRVENLFPKLFGHFGSQLYKLSEAFHLQVLAISFCEMRFSSEPFNYFKSSR